MRPAATQHFFTVDVEEHFQVSAFDDIVDRADWARLPSRVESNVDRLLGLLDEHRARATFFTLGCVAQRHPSMVRRIVDAGHEMASHGWSHRRVTVLSPGEFRDEVRRTRRTLEDVTATPVIGYRAPSFSITRGREWALDILVEEGYRYDSSLFPIRRPGYGYPGGRRDPHWLDRPSGKLAEFPPATLRLLRWNLPTGGGAYLRLFPLALVRGAVRRSERRGASATIYVHPWEVDPEQPRFRARASVMVRHYANLGRTLPKLTRLFSEFTFTSIASQLDAVPALATM